MGLRRASLATLALGVLACLALPATARAGELEDFQAARAAYDAGDYARAVTLFEELVGGATPRLESEALVLESRKYLGAAYLFVGRANAAEAQFELLLAADPTYELDPAAFPVEVIELFSSVRADLVERVRCEEERAAEVSRREYERERIRALVAFAEEEVEIEVENSRWLAALPFGVGQFQNGDDGLGAFFLVTEGLVALSLVGTLAADLHVLALVQADPRGGFVGSGEAGRAVFGLEIANWTAIGLFGVLVVAGITEAELTFHPTRRVRHRRVVPPGLLEGVELGVGPGGLSLRVAF